MATQSPLRQLVNIISASVDKIEEQFGNAGLQYPILEGLFNPISPAESLSMSPEAVEAAHLAVSSCAQLTAIIKIPMLSLYDAVGGFHVSSCIRAACEGNIVEILREAGPRGLHSKYISAKNGMDPVKISRILRLLATHYIFREITPDVFTNNRLSSMMDTLKSVSEIQANPEEKHVGTPGIGALIEHCGDEVFKASAFMTEALMDPVSGHSESAKDAPMALTFKSKALFEWLEETENEFRLKRFTAGMEGSNKGDPIDAILKGFDWSKLAPRSVVVDVGGGNGSSVMTIARQHPDLEYVVQDRPAVITLANDHWRREYPQPVDDGYVKLQGHDFFTPQPIKNASVFLLRMILHDYGHVTAAKILKHLRAAATPDTKLIIVDQVVPYACRNDPAQIFGKDISGVEQREPPKPLLSNLGKANAMPYLGDVQMYVALNGEERTIGSFFEVTRASGWQVQEVFPIPGSLHKQIIAVPA